MDTQIKIRYTNQFLNIHSHDSKELKQYIDREDFSSQGLTIWSPSQMPLGVDHLYANQLEEGMADVYKDTINLKEEYECLTCYIWLPEEYDVTDIDPDTILLNSRIKAACFEFKTDLQLLIVKFPWSEVEELLEPGEFEFACEGQLFNGTIFDCNDTITVVEEEG